ncbi:unnamed protein product [Angiostrongylus costaricensis]|uniref:Reverse transcriptase domain-containing protein n=1 Tax=Angiostrongylus costaricensis TaxID=334426 RepID=A0A0R3PYY4_ANGCS|nr:unnamed protein product [Angiostrongylus costaricensis]
MPTNFDNTFGKIGLRLNVTKTIFMKSGLGSHAIFALNAMSIPERSTYVYLRREIDIMSDIAPGMSRKKQAACGTFMSIKDIAKRTRNTQPCAHLFDATIPPDLRCSSET